MANAILTPEEEMALRSPIDEHVGAIQAKIDALRVDGTDKVVVLLTFLFPFPLPSPFQLS